MSVVFQEGASAVKLYSIAGRTLSFSTAEESLARMAESFLGGFYYQLLEEADATHAAFHVRIMRGDPPPIPAGFNSYKIELGAFHTNGEEHHVVMNDSRVVAHAPARGGVDVWMGGTRQARHPVAFINVMTCALQLALRRCGLMQLHSAAAVEPLTGAGVLVVGDSNSGKSSLTVRLARAGWSYLSDDMLLLHEADGRVVARALRRAFSVSARSIAACDLPRLEEALGQPVNSDPSKRTLDPSAVFPGRFAESCEPSVVLFPVIVDEGETRVESLKRSDALLRFLKISPWACFDADGRSYLRLVERLARQTRAYALRAGRDLLDDATLAPRLLAGLAEAQTK